MGHSLSQCRVLKITCTTSQYLTQPQSLPVWVQECLCMDTLSSNGHLYKYDKTPTSDSSVWPTDLLQVQRSYSETEKLKFHFSYFTLQKDLFPWKLNFFISKLADKVSSYWGYIFHWVTHSLWGKCKMTLLLNSIALRTHVTFSTWIH